MPLITRICIIIAALLSQAYAQDTSLHIMPTPLNRETINQPKPHPSVIISAFGDSLFAGYNLSAQQAFYTQLQHILTQKGYHVRVIPHAVSGSTSAQALAHIRDVISAKPQMVLLELGANDILRGLPPQQLKKNLEQMIKQLKEAGIQVILCGVSAPTSYGKAYAERYNNVYSALAQQYTLPFIPDIMKDIIGTPALLQEDMLHPNALGIKAMIRNILPVMEKQLSATMQ